MAVAVIDASVALKWQLNDEEYVQQAVALRDDFVKKGDFSLYAPNLWVYEIVNGLVMAMRRGRITETDAEKSLEYIFALGIKEKRAEPLQIYTIAQKYGISAYDAAYLAVADSEGAEFWTGDNELYQAVATELIWVKWIGDYLHSQI
jgi:predicted nucleic acid-binding protein